jgi:hypothetical protein
VRWQSLDPSRTEVNIRIRAGIRCRSEALKKDYRGCKKDDDRGERKCLKEGGRADLKGEREAVVAEISLTRQQVQPEESTGKKSSPLFNRKTCRKSNQSMF